MADTLTKILEIQVNYEKAIKGIAEYEGMIRDARKAQNDLKQALKEGSITQEQYDKQIAASKAVVTQLKNEQAALTKQVRKSVEAQEAASGSLVEWRAKLSNLTAEYDRMSIAEREAAEGKELQSKINSLTVAIKAEEEATQRFYRNVGNYENGVRDALTNMNSSLTEAQRKYAQLAATMGEGSQEAQEAKAKMEDLQYVIDFTTESTKRMNGMLFSFLPFGNQLAKLVPIMGNGFKGLSNGLKLAGQGFGIATKQALAFIATPIGAILTLIVAVIAAFNAGMKGSEENANKLSAVMVPFKRVLTALQYALQTLCGWLVQIMEWGVKVQMLLGNIMEWATQSIPLVGEAVHGAMEAMREAIELEKAEQKLVKDRREFILEEAKAQQELARLRNESADAVHNDTETRLAANKKAMDMELQLLEKRKVMAAEELRIAREKAEQAHNSAEENEHLVELEAELIKLETEYYNNTRRLQKEQNELEKSIADERKQRAEEYKRQAEERKRLAEEAANKELEALRMAEDAMIALVKDEFEQRRQQTNASYDREIDDLQARLEKEKNLTETAREAINRTIKAKEQQRINELAAIDAEEAEKQAEAAEEEAKTLKELEQKKTEAEQQAIKNRFEERLMAMQNNSVELARIELEMRQQELDSLHQMEEESDEAFYARQLEAQKQFNAAKKKLTDEENKVTQTRLQAASDVASGIKGTFEEIGQSNKAFAKAAKVLALAEIAINTGKAIAAGISQAQSVPYPANIAAIASTIAAVLSGVTSAISTVKSAKFARGGKVEADNINHANGGKITGAGTGTSDSIPAMLSNGEFVMTASATKLFEPTLAAMNEIGRGIIPPTLSQNVTIGGMADNTFADSLAESVAEIHPVVSVVDINDGIHRVSVIDSLDTI